MPFIGNAIGDKKSSGNLRGGIWDGGCSCSWVGFAVVVHLESVTRVDILLTARPLSSSQVGRPTPSTQISHDVHSLQVHFQICAWERGPAPAASNVRVFLREIHCIS